MFLCKNRFNIGIIVLLFLGINLASCNLKQEQESDEVEELVDTRTFKYGICVDSLDVITTKSHSCQDCRE